MSKRPNTLLFDLGGVIVPWVGVDALVDLTGLTRSELANIATASDTYKAYEIGEVSDDVFLNGILTDLDLPHSPDEFAALWNSWVLPPYSGAADALSALRGEYTLACLSNTNNLHWQHIYTLIDLDTYLDHTFASHLINAAKPHRISFEKALKAMNTSPDEVWFFDDTMENIDTARNMGITAFHVDRNEGVVPVLKAQGLI